jgi:hypothetical protein
LRKHGTCDVDGIPTQLTPETSLLGKATSLLGKASEQRRRNDERVTPVTVREFGLPDIGESPGLAVGFGAFGLLCSRRLALDEAASNHELFHFHLSLLFS